MKYKTNKGMAKLMFEGSGIVAGGRKRFRPLHQAQALDHDLFVCMNCLDPRISDSVIRSPSAGLLSGGFILGIQ